MRNRKVVFFIICGLVVVFIANVVLLAKEDEKSSESVVFVGSARRSAITPFPDDEGTQKIIKQTNLEHQARSLEKQGLYKEAIAKYQEALDPAILNGDADKSISLWGIMRIHQRQGKYQQALEKLRWFLNANPKKKNYWDKKIELEGLIQSEAKKSYEPIYNAIKQIKENNKDVLPPQNYYSYTNGVASQIIQLYDYVGDWDGGIAFIEKFLSSKKMQPNDRKNYLEISKAFAEDKTSGTKGRATQAIIQSDYFPW